MEIRLIKKFYNAYLSDSGYFLVIHIPTIIVTPFLSDNLVFRIVIVCYLFITLFAYQWLFLIFKKATPGMKAAGLKLVDRNGGVPTKRAVIKRLLYEIPWSFAFMKSYFTDFDLQEWERRVVGVVTVETEEK